MLQALSAFRQDPPSRWKPPELAQQEPFFRFQFPMLHKNVFDLCIEKCPHFQGTLQRRELDREICIDLVLQLLHYFFGFKPVLVRTSLPSLLQCH